MGCDHELNTNIELDTLKHHGVKGMRWGVRRFQNKDGSLTPAGEKRAAKLAAKETRERLKDKQVARRLTIEKAKRQMRDESKDREIERKNAERESKAKAKAEKAKAKQLSEEEMYELPDDSVESQKKRNTGKAILMGAIGVVGAVAAVYAFKKIREKWNVNKGDGQSKAIEDAVSDAAKKASAKEAAKAAKAEAKSAAKAAKAAAKAEAFANTKKGKQQMYTKMFDDINKKAGPGTVSIPGLKEQQARLKEQLLNKYRPSTALTVANKGGSVVSAITNRGGSSSSTSTASSNLAVQRVSNSLVNTFKRSNANPLPRSNAIYDVPFKDITPSASNAGRNIIAGLLGPLKPK